MPEIVVIEGLSFGYGSRSVFEKIDMRVPAGSTFFLGSNGAGKTTLFGLILGENRPAHGGISVLGHSLAGPQDVAYLRRYVGYLPQRFGYPSHFTALEFVTYFAWLRGVPRKARSRAVETALERVGLADRAHDRLGALSGGMLRRAAIAQAIVHKPGLLLLDEPTIGLDPAQRVALRSLLTEIAADASILVSTHLLEDVQQTADHVVVLHDGVVRFTGSPADLGALGAQSEQQGSLLERAFLGLTSTGVHGGRQ